jgi:hypothetical protein
MRGIDKASGRSSEPELTPGQGDVVHKGKDVKQCGKLFSYFTYISPDTLGV